MAKEKECEIVGDWKKSLVNHLYWSAVSTPDGNGELIEAKWISQDNHIHNKHKGHGKVFQACQHKEEVVQTMYVAVHAYYIYALNLL